MTLDSRKVNTITEQLADLQESLNNETKRANQLQLQLNELRQELRLQDAEIDRITEERTQYVQMLARASVKQQATDKKLDLAQRELEGLNKHTKSINK